MSRGHVVVGWRDDGSVHGRLHFGNGLHVVHVEYGRGVSHRHVQLGDGRVDVYSVHGRLLLRDDRPERRDGRVPGWCVFDGRRDDEFVHERQNGHDGLHGVHRRRWPLPGGLVLHGRCSISYLHRLSHRHDQRGDGCVDVSALYGRLLLRDDRPDRRDGQHEMCGWHVFSRRSDICLYGV